MKKLFLTLSLAAFALSASAVDIVINGATLSGVGSGSTTNYAAITNTTLRGTSVVDRVMFNGLFDRPYLEAGADDELILWANDGINKGGFTASWISLGGVQKQAWPVNVTNTATAGQVPIASSATTAYWGAASGGGTYTRNALTYTGGTNVIINGALGNRFTLLVTNNSYLIFTNISDNADIVVNVAQGTNSLYAVAISPARVLTNSSYAITSGTNTQALIVGRPDWSGTNLFVTVNTNLQPQYAYGGIVAAAPSPVGWWKLNDASGVTAADASGNGFTGFLSNSPTWGTGPNGNGDISFSTSNANQAIFCMTNGLLKSTNSGTMSCWFKHSNAVGSYQNLMSNGTMAGSEANGINFYILSGKVVGSINASTTSHLLLTGTNALSIGSWYHAALTWDGSNAKIYLNGSQNNTNGTMTFNPTSAYGLVIGADGARSAGSFFRSEIDDARFYTNALSASEILSIYNSGAQ